MSDISDTSKDLKKTRKSIKPILFWSALIFLVLAFWVWKEFLEDRFIPKRFGVVESKRIFRSGQISQALIKKVLDKHGIKVIVDLTSKDDSDPRQQTERQAAKELGIEYSRFPMGGNGTGTVANYAGAVAAIVQARDGNKPVLVHCSAGSMRTGGVIATYRLLIEKRDSKFILDEMKRYDWDPHKHGELINFLNDNMADIVTALREKGILEDVHDNVPRIQMGSMFVPNSQYNLALADSL